MEDVLKDEFPLSGIVMKIFNEFECVLDIDYLKGDSKTQLPVDRQFSAVQQFVIG